MLLTGSSGSVGRHLVASLDRSRWRLRLFDRALFADQTDPDDEVPAGALEDEAALERAVAGVGAVVHLAGLATPGYAWSDYQAVNVDGTRRVLEAALSAKCRRVVLASSHHVLGRTPLTASTRLAETDPVRPDTYYGASKAAAETLGRLYHDRHGLEVVCLRIGSFRDRPSEERHLWSWLSPGDLTRVVAAALTAPAVGFVVVWAVSANRGAITATTGAEAIGYRPRDDASAYANDRLRASELGRLYVGGDFCAEGVDGPATTR
ncbi:MAG: NAD-dependent epimerase/dehydratase family protein [Acidimicrobiales bacterium]